jgi:hypothetical protein
MYLKNHDLCFVQIPNIYEKGLIEQLTGFADEGVEGEAAPDLMLESLHPQRTCEKIGVWGSRKAKLFVVVQNTYDRLVYLYKTFYEDASDARYHNFGEFIRYVYEQKVSDTVDQRWYVHSLDNGDVDSNAFRDLEINDVSVDNVFIDGKGLDDLLSKTLGIEFVLDVPKPTYKTSDYYTTEIKAMVDDMYAEEMEYFNFKYPK